MGTNKNASGKIKEMRTSTKAALEGINAKLDSMGHGACTKPDEENGVEVDLPSVIPNDFNDALQSPALGLRSVRTQVLAALQKTARGRELATAFLGVDAIVDPPDGCDLVEDCDGDIVEAAAYIRERLVVAMKRRLGLFSREAGPWELYSCHIEGLE